MSQTPVISSATTVSPEETSKTTSRPHPPKIVVLADLNVDPPTDPDVIDSFPRFSNEENSQDKMSFLGKDSDTVELESKQIKKLGKARSRMGKMEFPIDCGADAEGDHNSPGVPSSREEKVSSLKTGLVHVARKMPKNTHVHFILGLMYQRMGQPQKAVSAYEKAEEILLRGDEDIDRPDLLSLIQTHHAQCILLGSSEEYGSGKEPEGKELEDILCKLNESMASDVRQASVWNTLGVLLLKSGHLQSAISVLSSLLAIVPENLDCIGNLGMAHLQNGNLELSAKCFQDLILKDQNHPSVFINYAALLLCKYGSVVAGAGANGDNGACLDRDMAVNVAKECLLAAAKADPKAAHVWTNLANAYYMAGDHRHSGKCLEKAAKLESNCLATRYAVAVHRIREAERSQNPSEQLSWAGNEMASILKEGDSLAVELPIAWAGLAMVHKAQHEIAAGFKIEQNELMEVEERALHSLKQAISEDPDDPVQWHQLGLHNLCTQDFKTSQTYLKEAVARDRECSYAWSNLGISLQLSDASSSQAEEVYKRALSLAKPEQAHTIFCNLGNFYRQQQQYECAKAMFTKSLDLQPGYAPAYNNLGLVFVAERRWEEAKFCFNKAFQADPLLDAAKSNMIKAAAMCRVSIHNLTSSGEGSSENANEGHQEGGKNSEKSPVWITSEGGAGLQGKTQKHHMRRPRIFTPHWRLLEDARFYNAQDCEEWLHHSIPPAECLHVQSKERIQLLQDGAVGLAMAAASFSELKREYQRHSDAAEELAMERNEIVAFRAKYEAESVNQQRKLAAAERATKQIEEGYAKAHQEWKVSRDRENAVLAKECERARRFEVEKDKLQAKVKALEKEMEEEKAKSAAARVDAKAKDQELKQHVTWTSALELESGALKMEVAKLKADKTTIAKECESLRTEKLSAEKLMVEAQAAQVETQADLDWLMSSGIQGIYKRIWDEPALTQCVANLLNKSQQYGLKKGFLEGFNFCLSGKNIEQNPFHDIDAEAEYDAEMEAYENISFSIMDVVAECAKHPEGSKIFRAAIEEADGAAAGGGGEGMSDTYHEEEEGDAKLVDYD